MATKLKRHILVVLLLLAVVGLPLTIITLKNRQEARSQASASTSLFFTPDTSEWSPLSVTQGQQASFDVMINPGYNLPSAVKLEILFDQTVFSATSTSFVPSSAMSTILEGPYVSNGSLLISLSVGSDPTKAIQTQTRIGTLTLSTTGSSAQAKTISFGPRTQVLSIAPGDSANENVLSTTTPAYALIDPAVTPTSAPSPTPDGPVSVSFSLSLHGIGKGGDNANPNTASMSNQDPKHPSRSTDILIYDVNNQLVSTVNSNANFDSGSGVFKGTLPPQDLQSGPYLIKIVTKGYLSRFVPGIMNLSRGNSINELPEVALITGDIDANNKLDIYDYNILIGCYSDLGPAQNCPDDMTKTASDINDDGNVNEYDYNLFLREIATQPGL